MRGGGVPGPPHAGRPPLSVAPRACPGGVQGAEGTAGTRQRGTPGSGLFRFTGLAARPSARAHEWPGERGPAAPVRRAGRCARRVPPRASARAEPLGLSCLRLLPPARSLPEPGLIWSRWRQGVGAAQPPPLGCQYPAHSPARPPARSLARTRARAPPPRAQGSSPNAPPGRRGRVDSARRRASGRLLTPAPRPPPSRRGDSGHHLQAKLCAQGLFSEMPIHTSTAPTGTYSERAAPL